MREVGPEEEDGRKVFSMAVFLQKRSNTELKNKFSIFGRGKCKHEI
jgi:hypothetical protein